MADLFDNSPQSDGATYQETCKSCGFDGEQRIVVTPEGVHYAKVLCSRCGRFMRWLPKPDADKHRRPAAHTDLVRKYSEGYCRLCQIREENIPRDETLEAHHVIEFSEGGTNEKDNIWIVCTACHKLIHHQRTYRGHLVQSVVDAMKRWQR